ncbi:MAG TPA: DUF2493 domain-containing protein [Candidatus Acidoferrales bacterium]|nr:DUF2493 domain-containing protein [Candidatus Acidoferrales bacterium]
MRLLVCGSREWADASVIEQHLRRLHPSVVIHGGARGADVIAGNVAIRLGVPVEIYRADWDKHGRGAGFIRNQQMLDEGRPDRAIAFWNGYSRGTKDMINRTIHAHVPLEVVAPDGYPARFAVEAATGETTCP